MEERLWVVESTDVWNKLAQGQPYWYPGDMEPKPFEVWPPGSGPIWSSQHSSEPGSRDQRPSDTAQVGTGSDSKVCSQPLSWCLCSGEETG